MAICCHPVLAILGYGHEQRLEENIHDNELKTEHVFGCDTLRRLENFIMG